MNHLNSGLRKDVYQGFVDKYKNHELLNPDELSVDVREQNDLLTNKFEDYLAMTEFDNNLYDEIKFILHAIIVLDRYNSELLEKINDKTFNRICSEV